MSLAINEDRIGDSYNVHSKGLRAAKHQTVLVQASHSEVFGQLNREDFMQTAHRSTWATYQGAWEDVTSAKRQELLNESVSDDCIYTDPVAQTNGRAELVLYIARFRESMPAGSFTNSQFIEHHDQSIAEWMLCQADVDVQPGSSWARFGEDGRITHVTGFFGTPEEA